MILDDTKRGEEVATKTHTKRDETKGDLRDSLFGVERGVDLEKFYSRLDARYF